MAVEVEAVVKPWYRQFYLRRGEAEWASDRISTAGYEDGLEAVDGFAYVGTTMYGNPVKVIVRVHADAPTAPARADRVSETRLDGSGDLAILSWGDDVPIAVVPLPDGPTQLRVTWRGTREAEAHPDYDIGGDELSPEQVALDLWPSTR